MNTQAPVYSERLLQFVKGLSVMSCGGAPHLLSLLKHPEERSHGADVEGVRGDGHDVVQDAGHLSVQNYKQTTQNKRNHLQLKSQVC